MGAKVASGKTLMIKASGDDAERAVNALVSLVEADFETEH
jgi:phosphotransferase system HPr-like phosphotransfer protein